MLRYPVAVLGKKTSHGGTEGGEAGAVFAVVVLRHSFEVSTAPPIGGCKGLRKNPLALLRKKAARGLRKKAPLHSP
jgi:hypothetical protein